MKTYDIAYVDVTCLSSIEEAIEHSCEIHRVYSDIENSRGIIDYEFALPPSPRSHANLFDENDASIGPDFILTKRANIELLPYPNKLSEFRDFYKCFTDHLTPVEIPRNDFNTIHELINRGENDSRDNFPSPRLRELISMISDTLLQSCFKYFTGIKIFSLKNEIIAFVEFPVIKPVTESFDYKAGVPLQYWGFYLTKPNHCLRLKSAKVYPV